MLKFFKEICFSELVLFQEILHKRFLQMLVGVLLPELLSFALELLQFQSLVQEYLQVLLHV